MPSFQPHQFHTTRNHIANYWNSRILQRSIDIFALLCIFVWHHTLLHLKSTFIPGLSDMVNILVCYFCIYKLTLTQAIPLIRNTNLVLNISLRGSNGGSKNDSTASSPIWDIHFHMVNRRIAVRVGSSQSTRLSTVYLDIHWVFPAPHLRES